MRALMAKAMGKLQGAETMRQESTSGKVVRELFYTAGADLLTAVQQVWALLSPAVSPSAALVCRAPA